MGGCWLLVVLPREHPLHLASGLRLILGVAVWALPGLGVPRFGSRPRGEPQRQGSFAFGALVLDVKLQGLTLDKSTLTFHH